VDIREYSEQLGDAIHPVFRYPYAEGSQQWQVPAGHYFMMGDNRGRSFDSRGWGARDPELTFVPNENVVGKAFAIWMHMPGWSWPSFTRNQIIQ
jgi:signal peptidase I